MGDSEQNKVSKTKSENLFLTAQSQNRTNLDRRVSIGSRGHLEQQNLAPSPSILISPQPSMLYPASSTASSSPSSENKTASEGSDSFLDSPFSGSVSVPRIRSNRTNRIAKQLSMQELQILQSQWKKTELPAPPKKFTRSEINCNFDNLALWEEEAKKMETKTVKEKSKLDETNLPSLEEIELNPFGNSSNMSFVFKNINSFLKPVNVTWSNQFSPKKYVFKIEVKRENGTVISVLRTYKHFKQLHQRLEEQYPTILKEIILPKSKLHTSSKSFIFQVASAKKEETTHKSHEVLQHEIQQYLNRLVTNSEILDGGVFLSFLDPSESPLLSTLTNPDKEGFLKINGGLIAGWADKWIVVKDRKLYYYSDKEQYSAPAGVIRLKYCTIEVINSSNKTEFVFKIRYWDNEKECSFKTKDEQERGEWVRLLRYVKRSESVTLVDDRNVRKASSTENISSNLLESYVSKGTSVEMKKFLFQEKNSTPRIENVSYEKDGENNFLINREKKSIKGGTVEKLIEKLTEEEQDMDYVLAFILTYRSFTTPNMLLDTLIMRFRKPPVRKNENEQENKIHPTQLRVCTVLSKWIEINFHDFVENTQLTNILLAFIENDLSDSTRFQVMSKKLKDMIKKKLFPQDQPIDLSATPEPEISFFFTSEAFDIFDFSALEAARQLSLIEFDLFKRIEPKECLGKTWNKDKEEALHLRAVIKRFNHISCWVVSRIVEIEELKPRAALLSRFIEISYQCIQLNNYNSAMEIVSALNSSSVHRLGKTWDLVPSNLMTNFQKIKELLSADGSYKHIREALHTRPPPCIPYFGLYLTDLTFIDDGNLDKLENGLINFEKNYLFYKIIKEIRLYQQTGYRFRPVESIQNYFASGTVFDDKESYELSLKNEPRDKN